MKKVALFAIVAVVFALTLQPAYGGQDKPEPTKDLSKVAIDGKWNMSLESPQGPMSILLTLKVDGTKVTGTLNSQMGETALEGQYVDGVLNFGISFDGGGGSMQISFAGKLTDENTMAGSLSGPMGDIPWAAVRVKE
jgi:hypothetical protein